MKRRNILLILSALILLIVGGLTWGSFYMLNYSLRPDKNKETKEESLAYMFREYPYIKPWIDSLQEVGALRDTNIYSPANNVKLHAYYIKASRPTTHTAVIVHGYTDNAIRIMQIGYMYNHDLGFNILLPDLQYHGQSEGNAIQMGWKDRLDVLHWMQTAAHIYGDSIRMVVHGISMGAATTMMVSGEPQQNYVKCFVEDCGYTSVWEQFSKELKEQFNIPDFPLLYAASWLCQLKYGWNFQEASALDQIKHCHLPMLFIHGDADKYVPTYMVNKLFENKPAPKECWIVPNAEHAVSYKENKEAYTKRVKEFVSKYIF